MIGYYAYTPYIWPMLVPPALLLLLAAYVWRHRSAAGAQPFAMLVLCMVPWGIGAALEISAVNEGAKVFWYYFKSAWKVPAVTAAFWFALEYADLGRWLTRRVVVVLTVFAVAPPLLALSDRTRAWLCTSFSFEAQVRPSLGPAGRLFTAYGVVLGLAASAVFLWLFFRSPAHRWPAAFCLCGHVATRTGYLLDSMDISPVAPMDATILGFTFTVAMYAVALIHFRMFELVPVARWTLIEQMKDGVVVLDAHERVVDLNPAAERILGAAGARILGRPASSLLPALSELRPWIEDAPEGQPEIRLGTGAAARQYALLVSTLRQRGYRVGSLIVLTDVTERRLAHERALEQQRALATLQERDRVARELHDGLGQVLGYAKMQAQAARELLARQDWRQADGHLAQLVAVAQDAHADVREYVLAVGSDESADAGLRPSLEDYVRRFQSTSGIATTLEASPDLDGPALSPMAGVQLLRIVQEALTNVRKHARARAVRIGLSVSSGYAEAVVEDDGRGFDPSRVGTTEPSVFGLRFMRERAEEVGGDVHVDSRPGEGTRVVIRVPVQGRLA